VNRAVLDLYRDYTRMKDGGDRHSCTLQTALHLNDLIYKIFFEAHQRTENPKAKEFYFTRLNTLSEDAQRIKWHIRKDDIRKDEISRREDK